MPKPLVTGQEEYFTHPEGFARFGIFARVAPTIIRVINLRYSQADAFESDFNRLFILLNGNPDATQTLLSLMDELRTEGLSSMRKIKKSHIQYHTIEHAAEVTHDTRILLTQELQDVFSQPGDVLPNQLFVALATTAAAWHDVIQEDTPPENEEKSAMFFTNTFRQKIARLNKDNDALREIFQLLNQHIDFISRELIVYGTWLIFGNEKSKTLVAKTLRARIMQVIADLNIKHEMGPHMERLMMASKVISLSDVNRFSLKHVLTEKKMLHAWRSLPDQQQQAINAFFTESHIASEDDQEAFLGLFGSNVRMFIELNHPKSANEGLDPTCKTSDISVEDYRYFADALDDLRTHAKPETLDYDYNKLFVLLMKTVNLKYLVSSLESEQAFSRAQQNETWSKFADNLDALNAYYLQGDHEAQKNLAQGLFILATRLQPGVAYLMSDQAI